MARTDPLPRHSIGPSNPGHTVRVAHSPQRILTLVNVLSLDAVLVAWVWQWMSCLHCVGSLPHWSSTVVLGLTVWLVYVADRLLDASRLTVSRPHTARHRFHAEHSVAMLCLWSIGLVADVTIALHWLDAHQIRTGLIAATLVLLYVGAVHMIPHQPQDRARPIARGPRIRLPKEQLVGLVFGFGVMLPVWEAGCSLDAVFFYGLIATLFSVNCICVACLEKRFDKHQGISSFATRVGKEQRTTVTTLLVFALLAFTAAILSGLTGSAVLVASSLCLIFATTWFLQREQRVAADSVSLHSDEQRFPCRVPPGVWIDSATFAVPLIVLAVRWGWSK